MTCQGTLPSILILCLPPFLHSRLHSLCRAKCLRHLSCAMSLGVSDCLFSSLGTCVSWWVLVSALLVSLSDHLCCLSLFCLSLFPFPLCHLFLSSLPSCSQAAVSPMPPLPGPRYRSLLLPYLPRVTPLPPALRVSGLASPIPLPPSLAA